jgi:hypothetical protein
MSKYCSENERVKRDFAFFLEAANGKQRRRFARHRAL